MSETLDGTAVDVALIVVTYNSSGLLEAFGASLSTGMRGVGTWSLTIVDNSSSDGTLERAGELLPDAGLVQMGWNAGYAAAINAGMRLSLWRWRAGPSSNGVSGYIVSALRVAETGAAIVEAVQPAYLRGVITHLQTLADLALLDSALRAYVPFAVMKGLVLATRTHPRADPRAYCDLDVLVPPPHFSRAVDALLEGGCSLLWPTDAKSPDLYPPPPSSSRRMAM